MTAETSTATASALLTEPQSTTAVFGDWTARCKRGEDAALVCEAAQFIHLPDQRQPAAQLILSRPDGIWHMTIEIAPDIALDQKMTIALGADQAVSLDWRRCLPVACVAESALAVPTIETWMKADKPGSFSFKDSSGKQITFPMSPRGLREALAAFP